MKSQVRQVSCLINVLYDPKDKTTRRHTPIDMLFDIITVFWQWFWNIINLMGLPLLAIMSRPHESAQEERLRIPKLWVDCHVTVQILLFRNACATEICMLHNQCFFFVKCLVVFVFCDKADQNTSRIS